MFILFVSKSEAKIEKKFCQRKIIDASQKNLCKIDGNLSTKYQENKNKQTVLRSLTVKKKKIFLVRYIPVFKPRGERVLGNHYLDLQRFFSDPN